MAGAGPPVRGWVTVPDRMHGTVAQHRTLKVLPQMGPGEQGQWTAIPTTLTQGGRPGSSLGTMSEPDGPARVQKLPSAVEETPQGRERESALTVLSGFRRLKG